MNIYVLAFAALFVGCQTLADPGDLPLMHVTTPYFGVVYATSSDTTANAIFKENFDRFTASGANIYSLSLPWNLVADGTVDAVALFSILEAAQLPPVTVIKTVDTTQLQLPSQFVQSNNKNALLDGLLFNDQSIIESFYGLVDGLIPAFLSSGGFTMAVGNEVDVYLASYTNQQKPFAEFVNATKSYIHSYNSSIAVGVVLTYEGMLRYYQNDPAYAFVKEFIDLSDIVMISYYPPDYDVDHTVDVVRSAFDVMKAVSGNKQFIFTEIGCPSGYLSNSALNTSQAKQALFFESVFRVIANEPQAQGFSIVQLNDWPKQQCDLFAQQYGINTAEFAEFLCTLGLMTETAVAKSSLRSAFESLAMLRNGSLIGTVPMSTTPQTALPPSNGPSAPSTQTRPVAQSSQSYILSISWMLMYLLLVVLR